MEKHSKNSPSVSQPSLGYIKIAFPIICHRLGFDEEPMYPLNQQNIETIKYYLDIPFNIFFGEEKYKTLAEKASAIFYFVTSNQSFPNGNKRTGVILTLLFLLWNGAFLKASPEDLYEFSLYVANNHNDSEKEIKKVKKFIEDNLITVDLTNI